MEAKELRLGNLVYWNMPEKEGVPHEVAGIFENRIQTRPISMGDSMEDYRPIPLSEEWLKRFGFIETTPENDEGFKSFSFMTPIENYDSPLVSMEWYNDKSPFMLSFYGHKSGNIAPYIQYVHQLQNLYFALTSHELETK